MPDFNILSPLVVTSDQRAQNYNLGIGDANTSELGSFLEGFQKGSRDWTVTRNLQLEAQTKYDPDKIASEQLQRDLENDKLREAVYQAQIDSQYKVRKTEADISSTEESTKLTQQNTRLRGKEADILIKYGDDEKAAEIAGRRASTALTGVQTSAAAFELGLDREFGRRDRAAVAAERESLTREREEMRPVEKAGKELDNLEKEKKIGGSASGVLTPPQQREAIQDQYKQDQTVIEKERDFRESKRSYEAAQKKNPNDPNLAKKFEELNDKQRTLKDAKIQAERNRSFIPELEKTEPDSPEQIRQNKYSQRLSEIRRNKEEAEKQYLESQADQELAASRREATTAQTTKAVFNKAENEYVPRLQQSQDPIAYVSALASVRAAARQGSVTEGAKKAFQQTVADGMGNKERVKEMLDTIDATEPDLEKRAKLKSVIYGGLVDAGRVEELQPIQKNALGLGLGVVGAEKPDKVVSDLSAVVSGLGHTVDSTEIQKLGVDPETEPYIDAMQQASKNGTQGFKVRKGAPYTPSNEGADSASSQQQQTGVVEYVGDDNTIVRVTSPKTEKAKSIYFMSPLIADYQRQKVAVNEQARGVNSGLQAQAQDRQAAADRPAPRAATPEQQAVDQAVEKVSQQYLAKYKKPPSPAQVREFRLKAEAKQRGR